MSTKNRGKTASVSGGVEKRGRGRGRPFPPGNNANPRGRPRRDDVVDAFFVEVIKAGDATPIERRQVVLQRLYISAMDTRRKDHVRLLELSLAYAFGRPRERVEMSGPGGGPIESADASPPRRRQTTGELRKALDALDTKRDARMSDERVAQQVEHYQRLLAERQARGTSPPPAPAEQGARAPGSQDPEDGE